MLFSPDKKPDGTDVTWGELLSTASSKKVIDDLYEKELQPIGMDRTMFENVLDKLRRSSAAFWDRPVRFVVETQFMLKEYLEMRKHSHIWYKKKNR